jgi:hypothetical protein
MKKVTVLVVAIALLIFLALVVGVHVVPQTPSSNLPPLSTRLDMAVNFTQKLFNPEIGLCRETWVGEVHNITAFNETEYQRSTNATYWIASDNYLESLAQRPYNVTLSETINQTCHEYYNGSLFPYQIMQGEPIPLTLHVPNVYVLKNTSDYIIVLNLYNGTVNGSNYLDYPTCGDASVYEAINYYVQEYPLDWCINLYMHAYNMFDGKGVADSAFYNSNKTASLRVYSNMKLALLVFGAKVLNLTVNLTSIQQQLWNAQKTSGVETGGITSLMNSSGQPIGTANGETTALTLLAYDDNLIKQIQLERTKPSIEVTFPARNFNQTASITTNLTAIPLFDNWAVTFNNTIQWRSSVDNPCVVIGLFSSLASNTSLSIQIVEYHNGVMDVVIHDASSPSGKKVKSMSWSNPLTISLISGGLKISSSAGSFDYDFKSFPLAYITAGSTDKSYVCYGGKVNIQARAETASNNFVTEIALVAVLVVATLSVVAVLVYERKRIRLILARTLKSKKVMHRRKFSDSIRRF